MSILKVAYWPPVDQIWAGDLLYLTCTVFSQKLVSNLKKSGTFLHKNTDFQLLLIRIFGSTGLYSHLAAIIWGWTSPAHDRWGWLPSVPQASHQLCSFMVPLQAHSGITWVRPRNIQCCLQRQRHGFCLCKLFSFLSDNQGPKVAPYYKS